MRNSKTIKEKNENLKKLIESGIEIRSRPSDEVLLGEGLGAEGGECKMEEKPKVGFKARKKVNVGAGGGETSGVGGNGNGSGSGVRLNDLSDIF